MYSDDPEAVNTFDRPDAIGPRKEPQHGKTQTATGEWDGAKPRPVYRPASIIPLFHGKMIDVNLI